MALAPGTSPSPTDLRGRIEAAFEDWALFVCRRRWWFLAFGLGCALGFATLLADLRVNNSTDNYLRPDDPIRLQYDAFREQFGSETRITFAIESDAIWTHAFLERLRALHDAAEERIESADEVQSLINARDTRGEGDTLVVGDLLEDWPTSEADLDELRSRVMANPLYQNTLISADGRLTTLSVRLAAYVDPGEVDVLAGFDDAPDSRASETERSAGGSFYLPPEETAAAMEVADVLAAEFDAPDFRISLAGAPVLTETLNRRMIDDMRFFILASISAIALFLALLFRRPAAVALPLVIVGATLVTTFGLISWSGTDVGQGTQILPSFLLGVGICDTVHILSIYYLARARGDEKREAIGFSFRHSALAILLTSLTTAGGLASFITADLAPAQHVGVFAPIGVMLAFVYTAVLLPAMMAILPMGSPRPTTNPNAPSLWLDRALRATGRWSAQHRASVLVGTGALLAFSLVGAQYLFMSHDPMDWLPASDATRKGTLLMNDRLGGVNTLEVVVSYPESEAIKRPDVLERLEGFEAYADEYRSGPLKIAQSISILDVLRETHQALHANDPAYYEVPREAGLIAQELLLFEGSGTDDLEEMVDTRFSQARMSLRVPWEDTLHYPAVIRDLRAEVESRVGPEAEVTMTGLLSMLSRTFDSLMSSMQRSYLLAISIIAPMMMLLLGSLRLGLLSIVPNLAPIMVLLGYMGWSETPIDGMSLMAGAIILGLAIDDTIHYMHNFRRSYVASGDSLQAIDETLEGTGRALLVTSLVLAAGFAVFAGAYMSNVRLFGGLVAATILGAFVSNVVVGSALMSYASEWGIGAGRAKEPA
ncbi:MAG: MMPL family transporter [Myxococcota bacterium]